MEDFMSEYILDRTQLKLSNKNYVQLDFSDLGVQYAFSVGSQWRITVLRDFILPWLIENVIRLGNVS